AAVPMRSPAPGPAAFPYPTLFRSPGDSTRAGHPGRVSRGETAGRRKPGRGAAGLPWARPQSADGHPDTPAGRGLPPGFAAKGCLNELRDQARNCVVAHLKTKENVNANFRRRVPSGAIAHCSKAFPLRMCTVAHTPPGCTARAPGVPLFALQGTTYGFFGSANFFGDWKMGLFVGLDVGTQSVKLVAYDPDARQIVATAGQPLDLAAGDDGSREQRAD